MPSLLDLPAEIRDDILLLVLTSTRPFPDTSQYDPRDPDSGRSDIASPWGRHAGVYYEPGTQLYSPGNATPLLLTNRKLHTETVNALRRLGFDRNTKRSSSGKVTSISYLVDVVLVRESCLWPTWLSIPVLSTHVGTVRACFRVEKSWVKLKVDDKERSAETLQSRYESRQAPSFRADCGPPHIVWILYSLLEGFLKHGPIGAVVEDTNWRVLDRHITVDVLELDFLSSPEEQEYCSLGMQGAIQGKRRYPKSAILRAEYLKGFIQNYLGILLNHPASYAATLFERIGKIRVLLDGKIPVEWDLAERLLKICNQTASVPREERSASFEQWKRDTLKFRRERGLSVIFPEGWIESDDEQSEVMEA